MACAARFHYSVAPGFRPIMMTTMGSLLGRPLASRRAWRRFGGRRHHIVGGLSWSVLSSTPHRLYLASSGSPPLPPSYFALRPASADRRRDAPQMLWCTTDDPVEPSSDGGLRRAAALVLAVRVRWRREFAVAPCRRSGPHHRVERSAPWGQSCNDAPLSLRRSSAVGRIAGVLDDPSSGLAALSGVAVRSVAGYDAGRTRVRRDQCRPCNLPPIF